MKRPALLLASLAFVVSGATSLVFQVVWSKALGYVLGNSQYAVATVVSAYLAGLAFGAWTAGRVPALVRRPLVTYGALEAGIGLFGLVSLALLAVLEPAIASAARTFTPGSAPFVLVRFLATFALFLVPTFLMGATLPVLVHWAAGETGRLAGVLSRLYALNTFGGVLGSLLAGFVLMPAIGLSGTARLAGLTSLVLGLVMIAFGRKFDTGPVAGAQAAKAEAAPDDPSEALRRRIATALVLLSGAVALTLEIGWTRLTAVLFGSSVYSFALVLAAFLVGIALGAAVIERFSERVKRPWLLFAGLQWLLAAGALWGSSRMAQVPWEFVALLLASQGNVDALWLREGFVLAGCVIPAAAALGALFPISARLLAHKGEPAARLTGRLYLVNTLGTVAGTLAAGFWLVPTFGLQPTLTGAAVVAAVLGMIAWAVAPVSTPAQRAKAERSALAGGPRLARLVPIGIALAALGLSLAFQGKWNRALLASGVFRPLAAAISGETLDHAAARAQLAQRLSEEELLFDKDGLHAIVTVVRSRIQPSVLALRVNGKTDASSGRDMKTQVMLGQLPLLWAPDSARVLVIGHGSGITTGSALTGTARAVDVVELEPAVIEAARLFNAFSGDPLADPRTRLVIEDGRTFLRNARPGVYDVISSEPSNPWLAGVNNLFTEDFYRLASSRLSPHGVLCQWIQFYEMSPATLASIVQAIARVFPEGDVFESDLDLIVIARKDAARLPYAQAVGRLAAPRAANDIARVGFPSPAALLSQRVTSLATFARAFPPAPRNTDDRPYVEYQAPRDFYTVPPGRPPLDLAALLPGDPWQALSEWIDAPDTAAVALDLAKASFVASDLPRGSRWRTAFQAHDPAFAGELDRLLAGAIEANARTQAYTRAQAAFDAGNIDMARAYVDAARRHAPDEPRLLELKGRIAMRADSLEEATLWFTRAVRGDDPQARYRALLNLGILDMRRSDIPGGIGRFREASALMPHEPEPVIYLARALAQSGRRDAADSTLRQAQAQGVDPNPLAEERRRLGLPQ